MKHARIEAIGSTLNLCECVLCVCGIVANINATTVVNHLSFFYAVFLLSLSLSLPIASCIFFPVFSASVSFCSHYFGSECWHILVSFSLIPLKHAQQRFFPLLPLVTCVIKCCCMVHIHVPSHTITVHEHNNYDVDQLLQCFNVI